MDERGNRREYWAKRSVGFADWARMDRVKSSSGNGPRIFLSAAEQSADLHGASLIRSLRSAEPDAQFVGVAGPQMQAEGCESVFDMTSHAAMLGGAFKAIPRALSMLRCSRDVLRQGEFDLAIVIDSPVLHIPVAKYAKCANVPVLYYIAPQLWAWGESRIRRVRARVDRMAVILAFEEEFFRNRGVDAKYVGHPLFDTLTNRSVEKGRVEELQGIGEPVIAIFSGSRGHVVSEVLPGQLEVAAAIASRYPRAHFCVSVANDRVEGEIKTRWAASGLRHSLHQGENGEVLTAADFALVASGTACLEIAFYHVPMVVMYNASRLAYQLVGRWVIRSRYFSLVNILAGEEVVPEFMPYYKSTKPIIDKVLSLLESKESLAEMRRRLENSIDPLVKTGAADNAAAIALDMIRIHSAREV